MNEFLLSHNVPLPSPQQVMGYLREKGWVLSKTSDKWALFTSHYDKQEVTIEVPLLSEARDYALRVQELAGNLERLEERPSLAIVRDVLATGYDRIRLGLKGAATERGCVDVDAGAKIYGASRDLLLAAACSAIEPRPLHARRKPDKAMRFLRQARFGPSEIGSYVLTVDAPVPPRLHGAGSPESESERPFARQVSTTLARALSAARSAAQQASAQASIEPFFARVQDGVSANLCEALSGLVESVDATRLTARFSFASNRPLTLDVPQLVELPGHLSDIFREGAKELREQATWDDAEVEGPIRKLESAAPEHGGEISMLCEIEGRRRRVMIRLEGPEYRIAVQAHQDHQIVRCIGELRRDSGRMTLHNARGFAIVPEDDVDSVL